MLQFKNLELADKPLFESYTLCHGYHNIEASFANLFLWRKAWNIKMATDDDAMYLLMDNGKKQFMLAPFLCECEINFAGPLKNCEDHMQQVYGTPLKIKGVTAQVMEKINKDCPGQYEFTPDRDNFEYVYNSEDLCTLTGKKYHAKRNYINRLLKNHSFEYRRYTAQDYDACISLHRSWIEDKDGHEDSDMEGYAQELGVVRDALTNLDALGLVCGLLFVDGNLEAFSIGENFEDDMVIIHIEKANPDIPGTYPLINREFARHEWCDVKYINREEDMGIEGLRKAKLSYRPAFLLEKFDCIRSQ